MSMTIKDLLADGGGNTTTTARWPFGKEGHSNHTPLDLEPLTPPEENKAAPSSLIKRLDRVTKTLANLSHHILVAAAPVTLALGSTFPAFNQGFVATTSAAVGSYHLRKAWHHYNDHHNAEALARITTATMWLCVAGWIAYQATQHTSSCEHIDKKLTQIQSKVENCLLLNQGQGDSQANSHVVINFGNLPTGTAEQQQERIFPT